MANRFTAVPAGTPPGLGALARRALPVADAFLVAMISRPANGTLASTWVTPATAWLAAGSVAGAVALTALLFAAWIAGASWVVIPGVIACLAFATGAAAVVLVAWDQRRRR
jgi:hypothetical protein